MKSENYDTFSFLLGIYLNQNLFLIIGTHCKADFYSQINEGGDYSPENLVLDDAADDGEGRRRSERGRKREKPDYYDSLEFENKARMFISFCCNSYYTM